MFRGFLAISWPFPSLHPISPGYVYTYIRIHVCMYYIEAFSMRLQTPGPPESTLSCPPSAPFSALLTLRLPRYHACPLASPPQHPYSREFCLSLVLRVATPAEFFPTTTTAESRDLSKYRTMEEFFIRFAKTIPIENSIVAQSWRLLRFLFLFLRCGVIESRLERTEARRASDGAKRILD